MSAVRIETGLSRSHRGEVVTAPGPEHLRRPELADRVHDTAEMRRLALPLALVPALLATRSAHAAPTPAEETPAGVPIAVAVNLPLTWLWSSFGASAWVGLGGHHAIRADLARYLGWASRILPFGPVGNGEREAGQIPPDFGQTTDLSVGWAYFPRRVLDGFSLEVGAQGRFNRTRSYIDSQNVAKEQHHTNVYSGHALVGWTFRLSDWWYLGASAGASLGYEHGREQTVGYVLSNNRNMEVITYDRVSRANVAFEGSLRVGVAFGQ